MPSVISTSLLVRGGCIPCGVDRFIVNSRINHFTILFLCFGYTGRQLQPPSPPLLSSRGTTLFHYFCRFRTECVLFLHIMCVMTLLIFYHTYARMNTFPHVLCQQWLYRDRDEERVVPLLSRVRKMWCRQTCEALVNKSEAMQGKVFHCGLVT